MSPTKESSLLFSMTGYGRGSASGKHYRVVAEIRSVNSRFLEIRAKLPRALIALESVVRELLSAKIKRGGVDVSITLLPIEGASKASVELELAEEFSVFAEKLAKKLSIPSGLDALNLLRLPGVIAPEDFSELDTDTEMNRLVKDATEAALSSLLQMRHKEGEKLEKVLRREFAEIHKHRDWVYKHREEINKKYLKKVQTRMNEWEGKMHVKLEDSRIYQEVAFYLDRSDVTEELDRLGSHLQQCEQVFAGSSGSVGKRLDFLAQEIGREINTIGSKNDQLQVTEHIVEMKLALERIREQVQNLE